MGRAVRLDSTVGLRADLLARLGHNDSTPCALRSEPFNIPRDDISQEIRIYVRHPNEIPAQPPLQIRYRRVWFIAPLLEHSGRRMSEQVSDLNWNMPLVVQRF